MLEEEKAVDQSQATEAPAEAPDTSAAEAPAEAVTTDDNGQTDQQGADQPAPEGQEDFIGKTPEELAVIKQDILNKYYEKTRKLAEERRSVETVKKDAETLQQLMNYKPFQEWYNAQKNGTAAPVQQNLTEEELEAIRTDPTKFNSFLEKKLETLVEQKYGKQMKTIQEKAEDMKLDTEYKAAKETYGEDFEIAHKSGDLESLYDKGHDFETAYAIWKLKNGGKPTMNPTPKPTPKTVDPKKLSEKPSSGPGKLPQIRAFKPKGFDDAFDQAFQAALKGEKIKLER